MSGSPMPQVPESLEGFAVLHQMFRVRQSAWRALEPAARQAAIAEATEVLASFEGRPAEEGQSACFSLLGHKGDLLVIHFRKDFEALNQAQLTLGRTALAEYLEPTTSYVSVIELGMYDGTVRTQRELAEKGIAPGSDEWAAGFEALRAEMRGAMKRRLWPAIPPKRYVCFYPMDKKRGEVKNWYSTPIEARAEMMMEHGKIGRQYALTVTQVISGSIGFDDWEWGVDLFADDPLVFKKLVYEMRFDQASADYGLFGAFYLGVRFAARELPAWLGGTLPAFVAPEIPSGPPAHGRPPHGRPPHGQQS